MYDILGWIFVKYYVEKWQFSDKSFIKDEEGSYLNLKDAIFQCRTLDNISSYGYVKWYYIITKKYVHLDGNETSDILYSNIDA